MARAAPLLLALAVTGCSLIGLEHNDPPAPANHTGAWDAVLVVEAAAAHGGNPLVSVEGALDHVGGNLVLVQGALFIDDAYEAVWLCSEIVEPQPECAGVILLVQGDAGDFDPSGVLRAAMEEELETPYPGLRWDRSVTIPGRVIEAASSRS